MVCKSKISGIVFENIVMQQYFHNHQPRILRTKNRSNYFAIKYSIKVQEAIKNVKSVRYTRSRLTRNKKTLALFY